MNENREPYIYTASETNSARRPTGQTQQRQPQHYPRHTPQNGQRRPSTSRRAARIQKRRKRQRQILIALIAVLLAVLILVIVMLCRLIGGEKEGSLYGVWSIDGVTKYEFVDEKSGAMVLPHGEFPFTYTIEGNIIHIDYTGERLIDAQYEFTLEGNKLIFKDKAAEYIMTKEKTK